MKYYSKLAVIVVMAVFCTLMVQSERSKSSRQLSDRNMEYVVKKDKAVNAISDSYIEEDTEMTLIIYDSASEKSVRFNQNMSKNLSYLRLNHKSIDILDLKEEHYENVSDIILIVEDLENKVGDKVYRMLDFAKSGGSLLFGVIPQDIGSYFNSIYRVLGIMECSDYVDTDGVKFIGELSPGLATEEFIDKEAFSDVNLKLRVDDTCRVYIETRGSVDKIPVFWTRDTGSGSIGFYNGGGLGENYYEGIFAGIMASLRKDMIYPIINAKVIFIDDFPSPQYNSDSNVIAKYYNRSVKEFYRDIWWPDMQKAAKKYKCAYTGLFVSTYNDIVNPENFIFENDPMMKYYGDSLMKSGFEMGLHGYNHQPLAMEGEIPDVENYTPWDSKEDMALSIKALLNNAAKLFRKEKFQCYVPPSNYLSKKGREVLADTIPGLKIISGVYADDMGEGVVYIQDFSVAPDGIVEFPRITSGMWNDDATKFKYRSGLAMHGVFSHFIHPDDILDPKRGRGASWEILFEEYCKTLNEVEGDYSGIRSLTASSAADAVKVFDQLKINIEYGVDEIKVACDNFTGEAFFYLRTEKKPIAADDSCEISLVNKENGKYYFMVKAKNPIFTIGLTK